MNYKHPKNSGQNTAASEHTVTSPKCNIGVAAWMCKIFPNSVLSKQKPFSRRCCSQSLSSLNMPWPKYSLTSTLRCFNSLRAQSYMVLHISLCQMLTSSCSDSLKWKARCSIPSRKTFKHLAGIGSEVLWHSAVGLPKVFEPMNHCQSSKCFMHYHVLISSHIYLKGEGKLVQSTDQLWMTYQGRLRRPITTVLGT